MFSVESKTLSLINDSLHAKGTCVRWTENCLAHERTVEPPKAEDEFRLVCDFDDCISREAYTFSPTFELDCTYNDGFPVVKFIVHPACMLRFGWK